MKSKKTTLKVVLISVPALVLVAGAAALYVYAPILAMKPAETGEIGDSGILAVKDGSNNVFVVTTPDGIILFDAGADAGIVKTLSELSVDANDVRHVFLTHTDYDHAAGLQLMPNAAIYMSAAEKQLIDGTTKRGSTGGNSLPDGSNKDNAEYLADGQELELGGHTVECVSVPGHTPGSMAYLLDGRYLFTGDAFSVVSGGMAVHPFTMDEAAAKASIDAISPVIDCCELVLTGHYGYFQAERFK